MMHKMRGPGPAMPDDAVSEVADQGAHALKGGLRGAVFADNQSDTRDIAWAASLLARIRSQW